MRLGLCILWDASDSNHWENYLKKIGTGTLVSGATQVGGYIVANGVLKVTVDSPMYSDTVSPYVQFTGGTLAIAPVVTTENDEEVTTYFDPSGYIKNSTASVKFDDLGNNYTWATAFAANNSAGFVKQGAGTLTIVNGQSFAGPVEVDAGKIALATAATGAAETLLSWTTGGDEPALTDFTVDTTALPATMALAIVTNNTTVSLAVQRAASEYTWTGAEADGDWTNPGNWSVGGVAQTEFYPSADLGDTIANIGDVRITVSASGLTQNTAGVMVYENATGYALTTANIVASSGYTFYGLALTGTTFTATVYADTTYIWSGEGADNKWTTVGNWTMGNGDAAAAYPTNDVTAVFPASFTSGVAVDFDAGTKLSDVAKIGNYSYPYGTMIVDCAVTFKSTGTTRYDVNPLRYMNGNGSLKLENIRFYTTTYARGYEINCELVAGENAAIYLRGANAAISINGAMTGTGNITFDADSNSNTYTFNGDFSDFAGTATFTDAAKTTYNFGNIADGVFACATLNGGGTFSNTGSSAITLQLETGTLPEFSGSWNLKKVGAANLTLAAGYEFAGEISKEGTGKFAISVPKEDGWISGVATNLLTGVFAANTFSENDFEITLTGEGSNYSVTIDNSAANAVTITLEEAAYTWNGGAKGDWSVAANWLFDGEAATVAPTADDNVTFNGDATVVVEPGQSFGTITKGENEVKLAVAVTAEGTVNFTTPTGFETTDIVAAGPFTLAYADDVWTATRVPATFTWTGAATDGLWATAGNWSVDGMTTAVAPDRNDDAIIASAASVVIGADAYVSNLTVNAAVTMSCSNNKWLRPYTIGGTGELTLDNVNLHWDGHTVVISVDLVLAADSTNVFKDNTSDTTYKAGYTLTGKLTGSGNLNHDQGGKQGMRIEFNGDATGFSGTYTETSVASRPGTQFASATSGGALASYTFEANSKSGAANGQRIDSNFNGTITFGAVYGNVDNKTDNDKATLEIGARNEDCSFGGYFGKVNIKKVGTAELAFTGSKLGNVEITSGAFKLAGTFSTNTRTVSFTGGELLVATTEDLSSRIKNSTSAITVDDLGTNYVWATALDASNTSKAIVKKGAGTLTLSAAPAWEGATTLTIEENGGEVILPASASVTLGTMTRVKATVGDTKVYEHGKPKKGAVILFF